MWAGSNAAPSYSAKICPAYTLLPSLKSISENIDLNIMCLGLLGPTLQQKSIHESWILDPLHTKAQRIRSKANELCFRYFHPIASY